jgi:hypothetical protein
MTGHMKSIWQVGVVAIIAGLIGIGDLQGQQELHHAVPKYLGGVERQTLVEMSEKAHRALHKLLDEPFPRRQGARTMTEPVVATLRRVSAEFGIGEELELGLTESGWVETPLVIYVLESPYTWTAIACIIVAYETYDHWDDIYPYVVRLKEAMFAAAIWVKDEAIYVAFFVKDATVTSAMWTKDVAVRSAMWIGQTTSSRGTWMVNNIGSLWWKVAQ